MLFKVWSTEGGKKAVNGDSLMEIKEKGSQKLNLLCNPSLITVFMEDGTEVDDDEILSLLPQGIVLYLCRPGEKPGQVGDDNNEDPVCNNRISSTKVSEQEEQAHPPKRERSAWPQSFCISFEKFTSDLCAKAEKGMHEMDWSARHELLNVLADDVSKYTLNPDMDQRKQVAQCLLKRYPLLKSNVGDGVSGWAQRLYDRMRDIRQKSSIPEAKAKRKSKKTSEVVVLPSRGEANWAPGLSADFRRAESCQQWMLEEAKKIAEERNHEEIAKSLEYTFDSRRSMFMQQPPHPLIYMKEKYPLLFTPNGLSSEFSSLQGTSLYSLEVALKGCCMQLLEQNEKKPIKRQKLDMSQTSLQQKRLKAANVKNELMHLFERNVNEKNNEILAFLLIPILLNEDPFCMFRIDNSDCTIDAIAVDTESPIIVFVGNPFECPEIYICGEGSILLEATLPEEAIASLFALYYVCNIQYPAGAMCSFLFIQTYLLKIHNTKKLPQKLLNFIDRL